MILLLLVISLSLYTILRAIYNLTFHPLASHPGPRLWAAFQFPYVYHITRGKLPEVVAALHNQFGPVVRIAPNEVSFISAQAWRDIYNARNPQLPKDRQTYMPPDEYEGKRLVLIENDKAHKAARDQLSHAFSPKALLEHQPLITGYVDQLVASIRSKIPDGNPLDVVAYFNWTTFDIIGHLTFGESFHCLDTLSYHPWIKVIFESVAVGLNMVQLDRYGLLTLTLKLIPKSMMKARNDMVALSRARIDERMKQGFGPGTRKDFTYFMHHDSKGDRISAPGFTSRDDVCANGETLIVAGSETTATQLSGVTFLLLAKRPDYFEKVKAEVRAAFQGDSLDEINFKSVTEKLPLMIAALRDALRYYPPVPFGFARRVMDAPRTIDGHVIQPRTSVSISQLATNHYTDNFARADEFLPERWLDNATCKGSVFEHDRRDSYQPFSFGPRNCLGKPLAELESRLIYAKMLYNFDFELVQGQEDWINNQTQSLIWGKGPLMIKFKDVRC